VLAAALDPLDSLSLAALHPARPACGLALDKQNKSRIDSIIRPVAGLGLSVLAAIGQQSDGQPAPRLHGRAARVVRQATFFVDIQPDQIDGYRPKSLRIPAVTASTTAPCCAASSRALTTKTA